VKKIKNKLGLMALLALGAMVSAADAQVNIKLTGVGLGEVAGGVYINPYTATIDGVSTTVLCDDFGDDSYINQSWQANVYTAASAAANGETRLNQLYGPFSAATLTMKYTQIADLAMSLLSATTYTDRAAYSFALWGVFDTTAISRLSGTLATLATTYLTDSVTAYLGRSDADNAQLASAITIYSPLKGTASCCSDPPQELITVRTPEASTPILFAVDLLGFGLAVLLFRRYQSRRQAS
jgi:hypothetical protein